MDYFKNVNVSGNISCAGTHLHNGFRGVLQGADMFKQMEVMGPEWSIGCIFPLKKHTCSKICAKAVELCLSTYHGVRATRWNPMRKR